MTTLRSALFLIVQQSQPYNAVHSTQHSRDRHNISSQMSQEILTQLSHDQALVTTPPPSSMLSPQLDECKAVTVLGPDLSLDTTFSSLAQPWVQLTPKADPEIPVSATSWGKPGISNRANPVISDRGNPVISNRGNPVISDVKGGSPRYVSHGGVVYAQVSPLSYSDGSKKKSLSPTVSASHEHKASLPSSSSAREPAAKMRPKPHPPPSHSDPLLMYHSADGAYNAPAPPPISVALRVPPSASQPPLLRPQPFPQSPTNHSSHSSHRSNSFPPTGRESEVRHTATPQAWVEETKANTGVETRIQTSFTNAVPNETWTTDALPSQTAARIDARLEKLASQSLRPQIQPNPGLKIGNESTSRAVGAVVGKDEPLVGKKHTTENEHHQAHARDGQHHMLSVSDQSGFDVSGLLESLRQLDQTQGHLQATADRLSLQKSAPPSSSSASSLMLPSAKHGQSLVTMTNAPTSSSLAGFGNASPAHSSEGREVDVGHEAFSVLTPIPEESTLTSSQLNSTLEEDVGERREESSGVVRSAGAHGSVSLDQKRKCMDQGSSVTSVSGSKSSSLFTSKDGAEAAPLVSSRTTEHMIKPASIIGVRDNARNGLDGVVEHVSQQNNHVLHNQDKGGNASGVGPASTHPLITRTLPHKNNHVLHNHHMGGNTNSVGSASIVSPATRALPHIHPESPSNVAGGRGGGANPGTWFALTSHLAQ